MARKLPGLSGPLARAYREGRIGLKEIAQRVGCSVTGARLMLIRAGLPRKRRGSPPGPRQPERLARMRQLRSQGQSLRAIARAFGVSKQRVQQILRRGAAPPPPA